MQLTKLFSAALGAGILALGLNSGQAQTANWIGPATGGEWNTTADWDLGIPGVGTNAIVGPGTNISYNVPMSAADFGALTLNGVLNVNAAGFNCSTISLQIPTGGDKLFVNNGGVLNASGGITMGTNSAATLAAGGTMNIGSFILDAGGSSHAAGTSTFTNNGGILMDNSTTINNNSGTGTGLLVVNAGTNNLGITGVGRNASGAGGQALGTEGLVVYGGLVITTNLNLGNGSAASSLSAYIDGGVVTNYGNVQLNLATAARFARFVQAAGLFVTPDPGIIYPDGTVAASVSMYAVLGGTNIVGGFFMGNSNAVATVINFTNSSDLFVGSQGMGVNGASTVTAVLNSGSILGATAPWTGSVSMKLNGGTSTIQTADPSGNPNNITLTAPLTGTGGLNVSGGGILTLGGANTYVGNTHINGGTLALGAGCTLTSPTATILIGSGNTFDASLDTGYTLNAGQTLAGFGTVHGAITVASAGTIYPGSNSLTGTLTFNGGLTENGGVVNQFYLSSNPSGPGNDFINASGGLNLSNTNTIAIIGTLASGSPYPLINYGGILTGDVTNLVVSGATGTFSNSVLAQTIFFIPQTSVRGPTNIIWIGNPTANNWDTETSTNWLNTGTEALDFFVPNDTALFSDLGATNPLVNIPGIVIPGAVIVNTTSNYTFAGNGAIGGIGSLIVSNGALNILTTNTYTGSTIMDGGVLATAIIGNSGSPSGIGAASTDPGNVIFNGGTLAYNGASMGTDHGMTLTNAGGTIDVTNGTALTLNGTINGNGGLTLVDSGTLVMAGVNNYTGNTTISNGVLNVTSATGLGVGTLNLVNGELAVGAVKPGNTINAAGGWITGGNAGGLTGVAKITGSANLGIAVTTSTGVFDLIGDMMSYSGIISFTNAGGAVVRFNGCIGSALATWNLGAGPMDLNIRTSSATNTFGGLAGAAGTTLSGRGGSANNGSTTQYIGGNNLNSRFDGVIQDGTGTGSSSAINKVGSATLSLSGANTYTGTTTVSTGTLALINNGTTDGSINGSSTINVVSGAILDVTGRSDDTLQLGSTGNQTLEGRGTINGMLSTSGSGTVAPGGGPGGSTGVLTVNSTVNLGGNVWMKLNRTNSLTSDELVSLSSINYGGTLIVTNIGPALQPNDTFKLFNGSSLNGSFSLQLPTYTSWDTSQLNVNGTIKFLQAYTPGISSYDFSQLASSGTISLSITNGAPYGNFNILTSTNLAAPLSTWTVNTSSGFGPSGTLSNFQIQVDQTQPQQYIIFQGF